MASSKSNFECYSFKYNWVVEAITCALLSSVYKFSNYRGVRALGIGFWIASFRTVVIKYDRYETITGTAGAKHNDP